MGVKITTVGAAWTYDGKHVGPGPWLAVVHEVNRRAPNTFGAPETRGSGDTYAEVYPGAEIRYSGADPQDMLVTIVSTRDDVAALLREAATAVGLRIDEDPDPEQQRCREGAHFPGCGHRPGYW